ncbi:MAG: NYN domain-containing protein [Desulfobacterales bacterium]|nr:NYN domain-containing protein [Desulfobacterales bacterium]
MWIIVDGYNLIRQWPELAMLDRADLESGRGGIAAGAARRISAPGAIGSRWSSTGASAAASPEVAGKMPAAIGVRYSRQGETADEVIARLVAEAGEGAVVVSVGP